ncbi:MAG: efflux RND transporter periplasmic adaptor subunit [Holosporaceae bacterium]|nr:efflux RND transporter periplasmic adaptor subunit [Holosporaceae bacterium]
MKSVWEQRRDSLCKYLSARKYIVLATAVLGVAVAVFFGFYSWKDQEDSKFKFEPPAVTVSVAAFGPVSKYIYAIGTLRASSTVILKSEVNARIEKILVSEGAIVKEGDVLIELDDAIAKMQLMEAEAQYQKAEAEAEPIEKLVSKGVVARLQSASKRADRDMARARVLSCKNNLDKHRIRAPFGGIVGLIEVSKGQLASQGADLIKIVDCHPLKADFKVTETDVERIYVDQEIQVSVGGDDRKVFAARITAIDPESDRISHTFDVRAVLDVPENVALNSPVLRPGRFVSVQIAMDGEQQGIVIPESALEKIGDEDVLYRVVEGLAIRTLVTVGTRRDGNVEIITGVNEGDVVITSGQIGVLDGKEVTMREAGSVSEVAKAYREMYQKQQARRGPQTAGARI